MYKKHLRIIVIGVLICMIFSLFGCDIKEKEASMIIERDPSMFMQTEYFVIDNISPLDELLTYEYELKILKDFFGNMLDLENDEISNAQSIIHHTWKEVNSKFPVQCVRYHNNVHYSVYKVKEGGYYYVFWMVPIIKPVEIATPEQEGDIKIISSIYLDNLVSVSAFKSVAKHHATARDVLEIDPHMELVWVSSTVSSYSLLTDGRVVVIDYFYDKLDTLKDLIVVDIAIYKKSSVASKLAAISMDDLP